MADAKQKRPTVSSTEVQRNFRDVLRRLNAEGALIVERDGVPAAALVPIEEYEQAIGKRERDIAERLRRLDELGASLREAAEEQGVTEEILLEQMRQTRREMYEERHGLKTRS